MKLIKRIINKHCKDCKWEFKLGKINCCNKSGHGINPLRPKKLFCLDKKQRSLIEMNKTNIEEDIANANFLIRDLKANNYNQILISSIENILEDRERLEKENNNLNNILKAGLSKEKQYCFNEDGNTGKCLGYGTFFDDEPCDYCKRCKRLRTEEEYNEQ